MLRRDFLKTIGAAGTLAALGQGSLAASPGWRQFEITYRVTLQTQTTPARVWVPVPQDALDYQRIIDLSWRSPVAASMLWEPRIARADHLGCLARTDNAARDRDHCSRRDPRPLRVLSRRFEGRVGRVFAPEPSARRTTTLCWPSARNRRFTHGAARQGAGDLRPDCRQHIPALGDARLRSGQHQIHAGDRRYGRQMRQHQLAVCRAGASGRAPGERLLRHSRRGFGGVEVARQIGRHHQGAALPR